MASGRASPLGVRAEGAVFEALAAACAVPLGRLDEDPALRDLLLRAIREAGGDAAAEEQALSFCRAHPRQRGGLKTAQARIQPLLKAARRRKTDAPTLELLCAVIARLRRRHSR